MMLGELGHLVGALRRRLAGLGRGPARRRIGPRVDLGLAELEVAAEAVQVRVGRVARRQRGPRAEAEYEHPNGVPNPGLAPANQ